LGHALVRNAVMSIQKSSPIVQSATDFTAVVSKLMPSTKVILIEDKDIQRRDHAWSQARAVPGIMSRPIRVMRAVPNQDLLLCSSAQTSSPMTLAVASSPPADNTEETFKENDWVVVKCDKRTYPGFVTAVVKNDIEVSVMEMAGSKGKLWKLLVKEDKIFYTKDNVLYHIEAPHIVGSRRQYCFIALPQ